LRISWSTNLLNGSDGEFAEGNRETLERSFSPWGPRSGSPGSRAEASAR